MVHAAKIALQVSYTCFMVDAADDLHDRYFDPTPDRRQPQIHPAEQPVSRPIQRATYCPPFRW